MTPDSPWISLLERVGFPVAVAAFVLLRLDRRLERVERALESLTIAIAATAGIPLDRIQSLTGAHHHKRGTDEKRSA